MIYEFNDLKTSNLQLNFHIYLRRCPYLGSGFSVCNAATAEESDNTAAMEIL